MVSDGESSLALYSVLNDCLNEFLDKHNLDAVGVTAGLSAVLCGFFECADVRNKAHRDIVLNIFDTGIAFVRDDLIRSMSIKINNNKG